MMQEFSVRFLHKTVTVTPLDEPNHFMVTMNDDDEIHGIVIPELLGIIYPIEDVDIGYVWHTDSNMNMELVEFIGQMIEDLGA
ncbi:hypothetical protein SAMN06265348_10274 [Pedobacter westerhofensis]|uniref:Uncharacterized protein n=2 Tax=Pedobacter westerhofensis TaxID=425512 RepID=A0A521B7W6_9SPHI|nr:hypothetical protein SAMN06265348_10274 [Pedobacter westerhofensis]